MVQDLPSYAELGGLLHPKVIHILDVRTWENTLLNESIRSVVKALTIWEGFKSTSRLYS